MQIALTGIVITEALQYMPAAVADHDNRSKPVMQVLLAGMTDTTRHVRRCLGNMVSQRQTSLHMRMRW